MRSKQRAPNVARTLSPLHWAFRYYRLSDAPFTLRDHPYLYAILKCRDPDQVIIKSAQVGASEHNVILALYVPHELGGTTVYLFPTGKHVGDFVQHRVDPTIESSPAIASVTGLDKGAKKVGLKRIGNGFVYFRGTNSRNDVISVPGDALIIDEYDECNVENVQLAIERLAASRLKWLRKTGTPTYPGGPIDREWRASTRNRYMIRCASCGEWQALDWHEHVVREVADGDGATFLPRDESIPLEVAQALRGEHWKEAARNLPRDIQSICAKCGGVMDRLSSGDWVSEFPDRGVTGWHVSRLNSPRATLASLYHDFTEAQSSITKLSVFYRMALGKAYDVSTDGLTRATLEVLADMFGGYDPNTVTGHDFTTMGVDVGSRLHLQISRVRNGQRVIVHHAAPRAFEDVARLAREYAVNSIVVDSQPETREAKAFRSLPWNRATTSVYLAAFSINADGSERSDDDWIKFDHIEGFVRCDRTLIFDDATDAIVRGVPPKGEPRTVFPSAFTHDSEWIDQMTAPRRTLVTKKDGTQRAVWAEGSRPDHYRLADVYDLLAMRAYLNKRGVTVAPQVVIAEAISADDLLRGALPEDGTFYEDNPQGYDDTDAKILRKLSRVKRKG